VARHFHQAIQLDPSLRAANDSLEFCLVEEIEERRWTERLAVLRKRLDDERAVLDRGNRKRAKAEHKKKAPAPGEKPRPLDRVRVMVRRLLSHVRRTVTQVQGWVLRHRSQAESIVWVNGRCIKTVPVVQVRKPEDFMKLVKKGHPVLIKNFQEGFAPEKEWTRESTCGRTPSCGP
jgi:hypothetical protein